MPSTPTGSEVLPSFKKQSCGGPVVENPGVVATRSQKPQDFCVFRRPGCLDVVVGCKGDAGEMEFGMSSSRLSQLQ